MVGSVNFHVSWRPTDLFNVLIDVFSEVESKIAQQRDKEPYLYLSVEFQRIFYEQNEHSVVYFEDGGEEPTRSFQVNIYNLLEILFKLQFNL